MGRARRSPKFTNITDETKPSTNIQTSCWWGLLGFTFVLPNLPIYDLLGGWETGSFTHYPLPITHYPLPITPYPLSRFARNCPQAALAPKPLE